MFAASRFDPRFELGSCLFKGGKKAKTPPPPPKPEKPYKMPELHLPEPPNLKEPTPEELAAMKTPPPQQFQEIDLREGGKDRQEGVKKSGYRKTILAGETGGLDAPKGETLAPANNAPTQPAAPAAKAPQKKTLLA